MKGNLMTKRTRAGSCLMCADPRYAKGLCRPHYEQENGKPCSVPECERAVQAKGLCSRHNYRMKKFGSLELPASEYVKVDWEEFRLTEVPTDTCAVNSCEVKEKARGLCKHHYEQFLESPNRDELLAELGEKKISWPTDDELLALKAEHGTWQKVAEALGVEGEKLRSHRRRTGADPRLTEVILLSEEERKARGRASARKWRAENPEAVKEHKRRWASGRDKDKVSEVNRYNRERRKAQIVPLTAQEALESYQYEEILRKDPCTYCGAPVGGTVDHVIAVNIGGTDKWDNKTGACRSCNSSKRDKSVLDFMLWNLEKSEYAKSY